MSRPVEPYSAHSQRAGFITFADRRRASDHAIDHQTRHRSIDTVITYIRVDESFENNAAINPAASTRPARGGLGKTVLGSR